MPLRATVARGHWQMLTFLTAPRHDRITSPCVFDGLINGERFLTYLTQSFVPTPTPGNIVIMD